MADVKVESNASAVAADMRSAARRVLDELASKVAEASIAFNEDMRGPSPGMGRTPFRTGNLLSAGRTTLDGVRFSFVNDAQPYSLAGGGVTVTRGESYASFAHFSGESEGQYAEDAGYLFDLHFSERLEEEAERALMGLLDV